MPDTQPVDVQTVVVEGERLTRQTSLRTPTPGLLLTPAPLRYGGAVASVVLITLLRMALNPALKSHVPYMPYFVAVVFSSWIGGMGPGVLSVFLGAVAAWFFFLPPEYSLAITKLTDYSSMVSFVLVGTVISAIGEAQRRAHHQTEEARQKVIDSEERFRVLAEAMPQFVWVSNAEGNVEYVNPQWTDYTGQTIEQAGPQGTQVIHPEDAGIMLERWQEVRATGAAYESEFRCKRAADGIYRWFLARGVPVRDELGRTVRWIGTSTNIDAQKQAEAEIVLLNGRLHRAIYESSHRIKNHLQTLAATVDMALMEERTLIPAEELQRLGAQIQTLSALQDILTAEWKADTSGSVETLSSKALLEKVLEMLQQAFPSGRVAYEVEDLALPLKAATSLALIVNETVANAIKHGNQGVDVAFRSENGRGLLEISDDGPGFPAGFDPVTAANTGLELISSLVVYDLHGDVRYENRAEGGAHVAVSFPLQPSE